MNAGILPGCTLPLKINRCNVGFCNTCGWNEKVLAERKERIHNNDLKGNEEGLEYLAVEGRAKLPAKNDALPDGDR